MCWNKQEILIEDNLSSAPLSKMKVLYYKRDIYGKTKIQYTYERCLDCMLMGSSVHHFTYQSYLLVVLKFPISNSLQIPGRPNLV